MRFLDHRPVQLALGFMVLLSALLLGFRLGQLLVSQGAKQIATKIHAQYQAALVRRSALASARAVKLAGASRSQSAEPAARTAAGTSDSGEYVENENRDSRRTYAPVSDSPPPNSPGNGPGNFSATSAQLGRSPDISLLSIAGLQILSSVAALLVGFAVLAVILYVLQRRWGIRLRLEMTPAYFTAGESGLDSANSHLLSSNLAATFDHAQRQRAATEREILRHLCQQNLLLHRTIHQQAGTA